MELTRNFTLSELTKSDTAIRKGINNNPNAEQIEKLKTLCEKILQPVRDHFGRVKVTSGFRSPQLCQAIGSSINSQHSRAEAADFECVGVDNAELADWIHRELDWDQLIVEYYVPGEPNSGWIHCSERKVHLENNFYMHIEKKIKLNTNLFLVKQKIF